MSGATSLFSAYLSAYSVAEVLRKHVIGCSFAIRVVSVQNLVSHASLEDGYRIDISKLYQTYQVCVVGRARARVHVQASQN